MLGRFDEAYRLHDNAADRAADLGLVRFRTWLAVRRFDVALLEGDASGAEAAAVSRRRGIRRRQDRGVRVDA
jgi:hypothetical protein